MVRTYEDITNDLERGEGGILAAWFIAELQGPVAVSVGYIEGDNERDIFYAWHHWQGCKAYKIGTVKASIDPQHPGWGEYFFHDLARFSNWGLRGIPGDYRFFQHIPSILAHNGNPAIKEAMIDLVTTLCAGRDWRTELFLLNHYGAQLQDKARWLIRNWLEYQRHHGGMDEAVLADTEERFIKDRSWIDWGVPDLPPQITSLETVAQWADLLWTPDYQSQALWRFAQMWVGLEQYAKREDIITARKEGTYVWFDQVSEFFARFDCRSGHHATTR